MSTRAICTILSKHGNCYVNDYPSDTKLKKIKQIIGKDITVRTCASSEGGFVIEIVKEVDSNVGLQSR